MSYVLVSAVVEYTDACGAELYDSGVMHDKIMHAKIVGIPPSNAFESHPHSNGSLNGRQMKRQESSSPRSGLD